MPLISRDAARTGDRRNREREEGPKPRQSRADYATGRETGCLANTPPKTRQIALRIQAVAPVTYEHQPPSWAMNVLRESGPSPKSKLVKIRPGRRGSRAIFATFALIAPRLSGLLFPEMCPKKARNLMK